MSDTENDGPHDYALPPGEFNHEGFDKAFDSAWEQIEAQEAKPTERKDLDALLDENLSKWEASKADDEGIRESTDAWRELQKRYGGNEGASLGRSIDLFHSAFKEIQANPGNATKLAEVYLRAGPYSLDNAAPKAKVEAEVDHTGTRRTDKLLDSLIESAIENAETDKAQRESFTAEHRAKLKEMFPGDTVGKALEKLVQADRDLTRDPLGTSARIAASLGLPVTPGQQRHAAHLGGINAVIDQTTHRVPMLNDPGYQDRVASVLNDPCFVHGPDVTNNLHRAIAVVQAEDRNAQQQVAMFENVPHFQEVRGVMADIVASGKADNLLDAYSLALHHKASVQKAKRAGKVKTSSGYSTKGSGGRGGGLDAAIDRALAGWSD